MNKYEQYSKEDLIRLLEKQEQELKNKKYGLVWDAEREPEQVVLDCENNLPVLKRVKGKEIRTDLKQEDNILIEGDNYHALTVLNYTHKEKIDVIYIDPPYNTGNKDFIYNDRYVDKEDGFRHSKWLNFMEKRLNLAKDLLKESGVIFISIDNNEQAQLKMLCDKVFGELNLVGQLVWRKKDGGGQADSYFVTEHEYISVYAKSKKFQWLDEMIPVDEAEFNKKDENGKFTAVKLAKWGNTARREDRPKMYFSIKSPSGENVYPIAPDGVDGRWRVGKKRMLELINKQLVYWQKKNNKWIPYEKIYYSKGDIKKIKERSILYEVATTSDGTNELTDIFGKKDTFENPKATALIKFFITYGASNEALILDFMAGSGTTGQAVLNLNKEDGGNRKFILCTNNENNICTNVCYPRLEKVIKGYKKNGDGEEVDGLGGNLQYFKTALVKKSKNKKQTRYDLTYKCAEMLSVKENIFNLEIEKEDYKIFSSNNKDRFLCIYFNYLDDSFDEFLQEIKKIKEEKVVYMFSLDNIINKKLFKGIENLTIEPIPQKILDVYDRLAKINVSMKTDVMMYEMVRAKDAIFIKREKDEGARKLRIVLEKVIQKMAQKNGINVYDQNNKEEKISTVNDNLKKSNVFSKVEWEENKTFLAIGNHAAHGEYDEYDLEQVENFYRTIQNLINKYNL